MTPARRPAPRARATLPRAPKYRQRRYRSLTPLGELGAWPAAVAAACDEAKAAVPAKSRGVLALVLVLMEACQRARSARCSLTRRAIADALGYEGRWAEESVRKLLNRAWALGEVMVFDGQGFRAPGGRGLTAGVLVPVRLLQYLGALPRTRRAEVLADPLVLKALEAREDALRRELGPEAGPRPPPVLYGREGLPAPALALSQATWTGKASSPVSRSRVVPDLSPEAARPGAAEGGGPPAAVWSDGAPEAGATPPPSSAGGPGAPPGRSGGADPAREAVPSPAGGLEARGQGPAGPGGAVVRGIDGEVRVDSERLRVELERIQALLAQLRDERNALACGRDVGGRPLPPRGPGWAEERAGAAELAAQRDREREIRRLTRVVREATWATKVNWRLYRAAAQGGPVFTSSDELAELDTAIRAAVAALTTAPAAWRRLWPQVLEAIPGHAHGARRDLAGLRCVTDTGEALVFRARDEWHRSRVRDLGIATTIGAAARAVLGRELAIEILEAGITGDTRLEDL